MLEHIENNNEEIISEVASKVRVALRVRPMVHKELIEGAFKCIKTYSDSNEVIKMKIMIFKFMTSHTNNYLSIKNMSLYETSLTKKVIY